MPRPGFTLSTLCDTITPVMSKEKFSKAYERFAIVAGIILLLVGGYFFIRYQIELNEKESNRLDCSEVDSSYCDSARPNP